MIYSSQAIVLKRIKYSDNTFIAHLFVREHGHQTFMINKGRGKSKNTTSLYSPLNLVEIDAYLNSKKTIQNIRAIHIEIPFQTIPFNPIKLNIAQFLAEMYYECIKSEMQNIALFDFLKTSIEIFDIIEHNTSLFHLVNLMETSRLMGFYPQNNYSTLTPYFNVQQGSFSTLPSPTSPSAEVSMQLSTIMEIKDIENYKCQIQINYSDIIDVIISFFESHVPNFKRPKSLDVFRTLI